MEKIKVELNNKQLIFSVENKKAVLTFEKKALYHFDGISIFVDSKHRGEGLGKLLVHAAVEYARKNRVKLSGSCLFIKEQLKKDENKDVLFDEKIDCCNY